MNSLYDLGIPWEEQKQITDWDLDYKFKHQTSNSLVIFFHRKAIKSLNELISNQNTSLEF